VKETIPDTKNDITQIMYVKISLKENQNMPCVLYQCSIARNILKCMIRLDMLNLIITKKVIGYFSLLILFIHALECDYNLCLFCLILDPIQLIFLIIQLIIMSVNFFTDDSDKTSCPSDAFDDAYEVSVKTKVSQSAKKKKPKRNRSAFIIFSSEVNKTTFDSYL